MNTKWFALLIILGIGLSLGLSGCNLSAPDSGESPLARPATDEPAGLTPEQVTTEFYAWYLGYFGQPGSRQMRNPLLDKAYRSSGFLTDTFIGQVDETLISSERASYDPFLFAQTIPECVTVDKAVITGDEATVMVHEIWYGGNIIHDVELNLLRVDGCWRIDDIGEVPAVRFMSYPTYDTPPEQVVQRFYTWYLAYIGQPGLTRIRNPLVDKAYWLCTDLTDECVQRIDETLASPVTSHDDPFLCVPQETPVNIIVSEAFVSGNDGSVVVYTNYFEGHQFTVEVKLIDEVWKINEVICPGQNES